MDTMPVPLWLPPVSEDAPAGPDPRGDVSSGSLYHRLRDARAEARSAERRADAETGGDETPRTGDPTPLERWRSVRDLARRALDATRDLEIGAWYVEAMLRCDGLPGFASGVELLRATAAGFWDTAYPLPDEDGTQARLAHIAGLNGGGGDGTLMQPLRKLPLFARPDGGPLALWQYEQSAGLETIGDAAQRRQRLDAGVLPFETVAAEARAAGTKHFAALRDEAAQALAAWEGLAATLDALAGENSPPTGRVRDLLARLHDIAAAYAGPASTDPAPPPPAGAAGAAAARPVQAGAGATDSAAAHGAAPAAAPPRTREDALRALEEIAAFFLRTEPLSPLSYTLQDAVRRGRMTWPELLAEIVPDWTTRATILTRLGIKPPEGE